MSVSSFDDLMEHVGHEFECVTYEDEKRGVVNVALECVTCNEVMIDYEKDEIDIEIEREEKENGD